MLVGSCQFAAITDQLATIGVFRSASTLRREIVADLTSHPHGVNGTHLSEYVEGTWGDYLSEDGTTWHRIIIVSVQLFK